MQIVEMRFDLIRFDSIRFDETETEIETESSINLAFFIEIRELLENYKIYSVRFSCCTALLCRLSSRETNLEIDELHDI